MSQNPLILIIDDEQAILQTLKDALVDESYRVETLRVEKQTDGQKALDLVGALVPDLILLDIFMPNCNGLTLLSQIKKEYPDQKVMIISGFGTIPIAIEATQKGALDFIEKPLNLDEILSKIEFLKRDVKEEEKEEKTIGRRGIAGIVGESHLFLELLQQAERLAPHAFPILIYGEHGTGKATLARYIHDKSSFHKNSFEIEKLSFDEPKTIFLKHVDQLDHDEQKKLLGALKENTKARIIASSTRSLFALVREGTFNSSLFAMLNKAPLEVPPLRKRPYDIPLLVNYYLSQANEKYNKRAVLTTQSIRLLRNHQWPGNITELKQTIDTIVIHAEQNYMVITPDHLVPILGEREIQFIEEQSLLRFDSLDQATIEFKRNFLRYLLRKNRYDIEQVSQRLNLSAPQLKNKLLELQIDV